MLLGFVYAAVGVRNTEGQEEESSHGVSAVPRREGREEKGQLEGEGLTVRFKNMRSSLYPSGFWFTQGLFFAVD